MRYWKVGVKREVNDVSPPFRLYFYEKIYGFDIVSKKFANFH